jgi:hypothetical protein
MSEHAFDTLVRQAAISRRGSLLAVSGAALATGLASQSGLAANDNKDKKKAKKIKKKFQRQCTQQIEQCRAILAQPGAAARVCCESCFSNDFLDCFLGLLGL